jgi:hypothetical protein
LDSEELGEEPPRPLQHAEDVKFLITVCFPDVHRKLLDPVYDDSARNPHLFDIRGVVIRHNHVIGRHSTL